MSQKNLFTLPFFLFFLIATEVLCQGTPIPPAPNNSNGGQIEQSWAKSVAMDSAKARLSLLKSSTLVIRLSTGNSKIKALEKLIASPNVQEKDRRRYTDMLETTRQKIRSQNLALVSAFRSKYSFSAILLMPDTATTQLLAGTRKGIFLNDNLEIDPSFSLQGGFFIAFYGPSNNQDDSANEGINVMDMHLHPIQHPFPSFVGRTSISRMWDEFFNKADEAKHYEKIVSKFQKKLDEFGK